MIRRFVLMFALFFAGAVGAENFVTTVTARQVQPWNGLVEIVVRLSCESNDLAEVFCTFAATNSATQAALPVTKIRQVGGDTGSGSSWTRRFIWDAAADLGEVKIDDVALAVDASFGVQLWENGPYWATCNVGATKPEESGYYFWWGDTVGYKRNANNNGWVSVKDETGFSFISGSCPTYGKLNPELQSERYIDATGNLVAAHDAATAHLGAPWRMPTDAEFAALISNCTTTWTTRNGVNGRLVTGRGAYASKSIFLPAAGYGLDSRLIYFGSYCYYWSSTPSSGVSDYARYLDFDSGGFYRGSIDRNDGLSVRPVRGFAQTSQGSVVTFTPTAHFALDTRSGMHLVTAGSSLAVEYSPDFSTAQDTTAVRVLTNGAVWVESAVGGTRDFAFGDTGLYQFTHQVLTNGGEVEEMSAWYAVAEAGRVDIQDTWHEIPDGLFKNCDWLTSIMIPSSVTNIGETAFAGCDNITNVVLHGGISVARQIVPELVEGTAWIEESETLDGDKVYKSNAINHNQSTALEFEIPEGMEQLVFSWKVGSENNYDWLTWYLDDVQKDRISGSRDWIALTNELDGAAHRLKFVYSKDGSASTSPDCGWVSVHALRINLPKVKDMFPDSPLAAVTIGDEVEALPDGFFADCTMMESVSLPDALMTIGSEAFKGCSSLAVITIPSCVTNIGENAFLGCENLKRVDVESIEDWVKIRFGNGAANPLSTGAKLYVDGEEVTELVIPEEVTGIGAYAFAGGQFTSVTIPNSVTNIGADAFAGCSMIVSVALGKGVMSMVLPGFYEAEFRDMRSFDDTMPIKDNARATMLSAAMLSADNTDEYLMYGYEAHMYFEGGVTYYFSAQYDDRPSIKIDGVAVVSPGSDCQKRSGSISFEESGWHRLELRGWNGAGAGALNNGTNEGFWWWTSVDSTRRSFADGGDGALFRSGTSSLRRLFPDSPVTSVTIDGTVTGLPDGFFADCSELDSVLLPDALETIGKDAFAGCASIENLALPSNVSNIGESAFAGCENLMRVDVASVEDWVKIEFANETANPLSTGAKLYVGGEEVLVIPDGTNEIVPCAFAGGQFTSVMIPSSVTKIGENAFLGCENLKRVDVASVEDWVKIEFANETANPLAIGAALYVGGEEVKELAIPEEVTEIGAYAFAGGQFTSVMIRSCVTNIAATAFVGCGNIANVILHGGVSASRQIVPELVQGTAWIEESETLDGDKVYKSNAINHNQSTAIEFEIPEGMEQLVFSWKVGSENNYDWLTWYLDDVQKDRISGSRDWVALTNELDGAARRLKFVYSKDGSTSTSPDCGWVSVYGSGKEPTKLKDLFPDSPIASVTIGDEVKALPDGFFTDCATLESVSLFDVLMTIGRETFKGCSSLAVITIPSCVTNIGENAFLGCESLKRVDVESIEDWVKIKFANEAANPLYYGAELYVNGEKIVDLVVPEGICEIGDGAFNGCSDLRSVMIPSSVTNIGENAFLGCENLKRVDVESVEDWLKIKFDNEAANPLHMGAELYVGGEAVSDLVIPDGTTEIGECAFAGGSFTSVMIPSSVMEIAPTAFVGCSNIVSAVIGCPRDAADGLLHRWGFNGDLKDLVGGSDATIVGNVTTDGRQYKTPGGSSGSAYIDLGDNLVPRECKAVTLEFWTTQDYRGSYDRIFDFGSMPAGYDFTSYDTSCYSPDNIRMDWKGNITSFGATGWSLSVGAEYHIAVVYEKGQGSRWVATYYIQDATGIGELFKVFREADTGWSFASVGQTEWLLGQPLTCWDSCAKASYNEVRIWNRALSEEEFKTATDDGPDTMKMGTRRIRSIFPDSSIQFVKVNDDVMDLPDDFFADCATLESVSLSDVLMTIGKETFKGCSSLAAIAIPSGVTNIGENAFLGCESLKRVDVESVEDWVKIKFANEAANPLYYGAELYVNGEKIVDLVVPEGVCEIGEGAFKGCSDLRSVVIPASVTNVVPTAFAGCSNIVSVLFGAWPDMLHPCKPETLGWSAVSDDVYQTDRQNQYNQTLVLKTEVEGPRRASFRWKATYSGNYLRYYIDGVQQSYLRYSSADWQEVQIDVPAGRHEVKWEYYNSNNYGDYYGRVDLSGWPKLMVSAPGEVSHLFPDSYSGIQRVSLGSGVTNLGENAFMGCASLKRVDVESVEDWLKIKFANEAANPLYYGAELYVNGERIVDLVVPEGFCEIGDGAFKGCSDLRSVVIPSSVTNIGENAFLGCEKLKRVDVASLEDWLKIKFANAAANPLSCGAVLYVGGMKVTQLVVPVGELEIGAYAFAGGQFTSVTIPNSVENVSPTAFVWCSNVVEIAIGDSFSRRGGTGGELVHRWSFDGDLTDSAGGLLASVVGSVTSSSTQYTLSGGPNGSSYISLGSNILPTDTGAATIEIWATRNAAKNWARIIDIGSSTGNYLIWAWNNNYYDYDNVDYNNLVNIPTGGTIPDGAECYFALRIEDRNDGDGLVTCSKYDAQSGSLIGDITSFTMRSWQLKDIGQSSCYLGHSRWSSDSDASASYNEVRVWNYALTEDEIRENVAAGSDSIRANSVKDVFSASYDRVRIVRLTEGTKSIVAGLFSGCSSLETITIPSSVTNIGANAFLGCQSLKRVDVASSTDWLKIRFANAAANPLYYGAELYVNGEKIVDLVVPEGTGEIGEGAFKGCSDLRSVMIPSSVTNIAMTAFVGCDNITNVVLYGGVSATRLRDLFPDAPLCRVEIGGAITELPQGFFDGLEDIEELIIPEKAELPSDAFAVFPKLRSVETSFAGVKLRYDRDGVVDSVELTSGRVVIPRTLNGQLIRSIAEGAFAGMTGISAVEIGKGVENVGAGAFDGCVNLSELVLPEGIVLGFNPFDRYPLLAWVETVTDACRFRSNREGHVSPVGNCSGIVRIPGSPYGYPIVKIAEGAFAGMTGITAVEIGEGIVELGDGAFVGCTSLLSIVLPETLEDFGDNDVREIGRRGGKSGLWVQDGWVLGYIGTAPAEVTIPDGVKGIAAYAFEGQYDLERVVLPDSLKFIGKDAFAGCTSLEGLDLPEGCGRIDDGAFRDCTWIQEVSLASGLTNIGAAAFANCTGLSVLVAPEGLKAMGEGAFSNCWRMVSVSLPVSLDEVGENCFWNCKNLSGVTVPTHVCPLKTLFPAAYDRLTSIVIAGGEDRLVEGAFDGCATVKEIVLPEVVTELPEAAFRDCVSLERMAFPAAVKSIGDEAFEGCVGLTRLNLPAGLETIGAKAFEGLSELEQVAIPDGVTAIGAGAFAGCGAVRQVRLPGDVTTLAAAFPDAYKKIVRAEVPEGTTELVAGLFDGCAALESFTIPASVTDIGARAFAGCGALKAVVLPQGLKAIGDAAFSGVSGILELEIPSSVESLGAGVFTGCAALRSVTLPGDTGTLAGIFPDAYVAMVSVTLTAGTETLNDGFFAGCASLKAVELPTSVAAIGAGAFADCTSLASVGIPAGVTSLGAGAFRGCSALAEVTLPGGLSVLEDEVFAGCALLASVTVPESVTTLGSRIFDGCTALRLVKFIGNAPQVAADAYAGTPGELVTQVATGSRGWDGIATSRNLPEFWPSGTTHGIGWWDPNRFEVTFDYNDGSGASETVEEITDTTYKLPDVDPVHPGAAFLGWWTEAVNGARITPVSRVMRTSAHTLYAHWRPFSYTVTFDANGGTGTMEDQAMTVDEPTRLPSRGFVRINHDFAGWALEPEGEVAFADGEEVVNLSSVDGGTVRLYAVWVEREWTAADYLGVQGLVFTSEGDADWFPDVETSHDGIGSMRSGEIGIADEGEITRSTLRTTVAGKGTLTFWWKVNCEGPDPDYGDLYDYLEFTVDGERPATVEPIAGDVDWMKVEVRIEGGVPTHELAWSFVKDDWDEESLPDIAWVDELTWTPDPVTVTFDGNGATEGIVPAAVTSAAGVELVLPDAGTLRKGPCKFVGWSDGKRVYAAGETYVVGSADVTLSAVWEEFTIADALNATNLVFTTGGDAAWAFDFETSHDGEASMRSGAVGTSQTSWIEATVNGAGTLTFVWKADGLLNRGKPANYVQYVLDGGDPVQVAVCDWTAVEVEVKGAGEHTVRWMYLHTRSQDTGADCAWIDEVEWTVAALPKPSVGGDEGATVTGDAETGFVIKPSEGKTAVEVTIPQGVEAAKVTVEVSPKVASVKPNGAKVKIVVGGADITEFLNVPAADGNGVVDLTKATVKEEIVKETLDSKKGAKIELDAADPQLTTSNTRIGLFYTFSEGRTLGGMERSASKTGDGQPWSPEIKVKGGNSAFYSIGVGKGE